MASLDAFGAPTRAWFQASFAGPTPVQERGWARIAAGEHALLTAPTGSGKTLAAFLWALDRLAHAPPDPEPTVRVLYISPLKSLAHDVERNLRAPLAGIARAAEAMGQRLRPVRVGLRTGDTPARERRQLGKDPAELLITTPESLYLLLTTNARQTLRGVDTVIVDEIHALAASKRGAHLALSLERLAALAGPGRDPQRIGLSATMRPLDEIARYLGGDRPVSIVDAGEPPHLSLSIELPAPADAGTTDSMVDEALPEIDFDDRPRRRPTSSDAALDARLVELLRAHRSTIVFVNSRRLCERLAQRLNDLAGEPLVRAHHGSLARPQRLEIEELLKAGQLRGIVATSSLELGLDMAAVDLVVQIASPGSVARGLQRVGRAGHQVGASSEGVILPRHRMDLLECAVVAQGMRAGDVEPVRVPRLALDVLAQQIVAMTTVDAWSVDALAAVVTRAHGYRQLSRAQLVNVLDMLAGRLPADDFPDLRPRLVWDRTTDTLTARRDARLVAIVNGGTIPDRGLYTVHLGEDGPRVGELDEEMVHESRPGHVFLLGASSWRIERITRDRVIVTPAPGEPGRMPFWRGEGPGRPIGLGRALGAFVRELGERPTGKARRWLAEAYDLDGRAAEQLVAYVHEQQAATGAVPSDRSIVIERFRDELGDWRVCILTPFGAKVHAPWALALEGKLGRGGGAAAVQCIASDDGIVVRIADGDELPDAARLVPGAEEIEALLVDELGRSATFATHFRENAARALLLPRRRPGARTPLWLQRARAQELLDAARRHAAFPIVLETVRELLDDVFDVPALVEVLRGIGSGAITVHSVETAAPSPFARDLAYAFVAAYLYDGDAPLAERKAQALALDRTLLAELLGAEDLRELLDAAVIDELEEELQARADDFRARSADALHDLLRRIGDLSDAEVAERCEGDAAAFTATLAATGRALRVRLAGGERWIAVEDIARYRDGLGVPVPPGVPLVYLETSERPLETLFARFARTHGPFTLADAALRFGVAPAAFAPAARALVAAGKLVEGAFRPGGGDAELCDAEVLRTLRRRSLARLRQEVAPVDAAALARFLGRWHGVDGAEAARGGPVRLREVIETLEGLPLPFSELERAILPARIAGYEPRLLDDLGAVGEVVWIATGPSGASGDVKVALYRRERVPFLHVAAPPAPDAPPLSPLAERLLAHLSGSGASFFGELAALSAPAGPDDVLAALWELCLRGLVANDTFAPLRARAAKASGRRPVRSLAARAGGRWFLVASLFGRAVSATEKAHARALALLERHGVVSREVVAAEDVPGGWAAVVPVLRALEESGKARRGHFVDGFAGAQFARPDAVDRLRAARSDGAAPDARATSVLSAVDPANPWGGALAWPGVAELAPAARPRRAAGARVVLVHGQPVLYLERGGKALRVLPGDHDDGAIEAAARALAQAATVRRGRDLRVDRIDGEDVYASPHFAALLRGGFVEEPGSLVLRAGPTAALAPMARNG